jgi:rSAM/selenodomain-associated transferase 1
MEKPVVVVFAKAPRPGFVKTRLIPQVGAEGSCRLHEAFVQDTLDILREVESICDIEIHADFLWDTWAAKGRTLKLQTKGDLGIRMRIALEAALSESRPLAVILGSDSPTLPAAHVRQILECPADVCLGPASDGGFYAIACRKIMPAMFDGVAWSSPQTLEQTIAAIENTGLTVTLGPGWYDIDSGDDLQRLLADKGIRPATAEALRSVGLPR